MDWEIVLKILLLLDTGLFAIGTTIIIAEDKKRKRIKNHIDGCRTEEKRRWVSFSETTTYR